MPFKNESIIWSIKEIVEIIRRRQLNKYDANVCVTGERGDGKSTCINKILIRMKGFNQNIHQVYNREKVVKLLRDQKFSFCWDDEAINSGYKRNFYQTGQIELIKIVTAYRDNYNTYFSALPSFYSLDKDLRDLIFMHIHIIERGFAVVFLPLPSIYSRDKWDTYNNERKERKWTEKQKRLGTYKIPYHRLSTFAGYLYFNDLTEKQRRQYEKIKIREKAESFRTDKEKKNEKELGFYENLMKLLLAGDLTKESLKSICLVNNRKFDTVYTRLNKKLIDQNVKKALKDLLLPPKGGVHKTQGWTPKKLVPAV